MKLSLKKALIVLSMASMLLLSGCREESSSSQSGNSLGEPGGYASGSSASESGSYAPSSSQPSSSSRSESLTTAPSAPAMSPEFEEIGKLPAKSLDWGPGGPVDEKNRSQGSLSYNNKYGKYGASFIGADEKTVYMTFDEGYEYGLTGSVLDTLKEKNVKAVFFVTYDFANRSGELVQRMIDEGHVVGNHSYSHKNYSTLAPKEAADDLMKMHSFVKDKFGYEMCYFRFPSGNFNEQSLAVVQKMGYKTLFWSFAYKDWIVDDQPEPKASADKIVKAACPGNIYLLHAVSATNDQILGEVIDRIRAEGYTWGDPSVL